MRTVILDGHPPHASTTQCLAAALAAPPVSQPQSSADDSAACLHRMLLEALAPPVQELILTDLLDLAARSDIAEQQAAYIAFILLVHSWPSCKCTSFRTTALIRLTSQLLHQTDDAVRDLIHLAIEQLKTNYSTD